MRGMIGFAGTLTAPKRRQIVSGCRVGQDSRVHSPRNVLCVRPSGGMRLAPSVSLERVLWVNNGSCLGIDSRGVWSALPVQIRQSMLVAPPE